jgi:methyl-accepting chemotaxis protein
MANLRLVQPLLDSSRAIAALAGNPKPDACWPIRGANVTIRRLVSVFTLATLVLLCVLILTIWSGFRTARESARNTNAVALPALVAILEARFYVVQVQQFLTDVSATGESGGFKEAQTAYDEAIKDLDRIARLEPMLADQVTQAKEGLGRFNALGIEMAKAYISGGRDAGNALMKRPNDGFDAQAEGLTGQLERIEKTVRDHMTESAGSAETGIRQAQGISTGLGVAVGGLMMVSGFMLYRSLIRILGGEPVDAARVTQRIASGDLTQDISIRPDDRSSLLAAIRGMQESLRTIIRGIGESADTLTASAHDISLAANQVSAAANLQNDKSASMAASIEEMAVSITHIMDSAAGAHQSAADAQALSDVGEAAVTEAIAEMDGISAAVMTTAGSVRELGERSAQISKIVDVIREIADQTNLLALNAAIEAARAGEQGRGFAVVADEVRKLAERTTQATREIKATVDSVRDGTVKVVKEMADGSDRVQAGVVLIRRAGETMSRIQGGVGHMMSAAEEISASLRQQNTANHDIARNVEEIAQMTEETSAVVSSVAKSADHLEKLSVSMSASVHQFRI